MVKNVNVVKAYEIRKKYLDLALEMIEQIGDIHISTGNSKMGMIPSFSVLPLITCKHCSECSHNCYACLNNFNFPSNIENLAENTALVMEKPEKVIEQLNNFLNGSTIIYKYFRFNVAGDFFSDNYSHILLEVAQANPWTTFLVFTKNYELFNEYMDNNELPKNISLVYSQWGNTEIDNPHNRPVAIVKLDETTKIPEGSFHCTGNCTECLECWKAQPGTTRHFDIH